MISAICRSASTLPETKTQLTVIVSQLSAGHWECVFQVEHKRGLRSTYDISGSREARQLLARGRESLSLAVGGERANPPARAGVRNQAARSVRQRVTLTPAGEVLFEYANRLLALRGESLRAVVDQDSTPRGVLAIGANEATCLYVIARDLQRIPQALFSDVQISIYRNFSHKILERLQDGLIDVGIVTMPVKAQRLVVKRIFHDRLVLMTSPNHPLGRLDSVSVEAMADYPIILPKAGHTRKTMDKLFRPYQSQLRIAMELPSIAMIKAFVASGMGISLISESFARKECHAGDLRLVPLSDATCRANWHWCTTRTGRCPVPRCLHRNGAERSAQFKTAGAFEMQDLSLIEADAYETAVLEN